MSPLFPARRLLAVAGSTGLLTLAASGLAAAADSGQSVQSTRSAVAASELISTLFPGAVANLVPDPEAPGGVQLAVTLTTADLGPLGTSPLSLLGSLPLGGASGGPAPGPSSLQSSLPSLPVPVGQTSAVVRQFDYANVGWALGVAAATLAQSQPDLTSYQATVAGQVPDDIADDLAGIVRLSPGVDPLGPTAAGALPKLGSITQAEAQAQANANVATLRAGLAAGQLQDAKVSIVPLNGDHQFAVSVDLTVQSLPAVSANLGDLLNGMATGLTGDSDATVEGLAVDVQDATGARLSSLSAPRAQTGDIEATDSVDLGDGLTVTLPFTSITGGPGPISSAFGTSASASALEQPITIHSGRTSARSTGTVCPSNAGCAGLGIRPGMPRPLTLQTGRHIKIRLPYAASRVTVSVLDADGADLYDKTVSKRHGSWQITLPKGLGTAHAVSISATHGNDQVNYLIGAKHAR